MANIMSNASLDKQAFYKKLAENLQNDLKALSNEARRKYQHVKEAAETGMVKVRTLMSRSEDIISAMQNDSTEILQPFILGCDTKNFKIVQISMTGIQRLIAHGAISTASAEAVVNCLWTLMETGIEEVKLLQTVLLLLNNGNHVQGHALSKALVLCLRLHVVKDSTTINAASATVRQLVSLVFERVVEEDKVVDNGKGEALNIEELKICQATPPKSLAPCAADAYLLFQDLIQLVNLDRPVWLLELHEMSRTFGLELLEEILTSFCPVFIKHQELSFLLKERVCPLIIKLFSPNVKHRLMSSTLGSLNTGSLSNCNSSSINSSSEKPCFPVTVRLLRVVSVLIHKYHALLVTECEIFLSLVVKFLDVEQPPWQRALALGVIHRIVVQPKLISSFCRCYDSKPHSTKILQDIVNALGSYVHSLFVTTPIGQSLSGVSQVQVQGSPPTMLGGMPVGPGITPQPGFLYHGVWIPLIVTFSAGTAKSVYLDYLDKSDIGPLPDGYGISIAYACLLDIVRSICLEVEGVPPSNGSQCLKSVMPVSNSSPDTKVTTATDASSVKLNEQLVESTWCGLLAAFCLLLEASTDESASENILKSMQSFTRLAGYLYMTTARDAFVTALCKASLPPYYTLTVLSENHAGSGESNHASSSMSFIQGSDYASTAQSSIPSAAHLAQYLTETEFRPQVVAVGTPLPTSSLQSGGNHGSVVLTTKNLQCMRSILVLAHCHGSVLGTAWHLVLTTLQHLVWILGLKPSTGGSLKAGRTNDSCNTVITTAVLADLPILSAMLSRLFESSQYLDDVALHHLVDALCRLSQESMELAYTNREPSLFAVAKLLETGLVNLPRLEVLWRPLTNHLLEVCCHPHVKMREWGVEAVTSLVKEAFACRLKDVDEKSPVAVVSSFKGGEEPSNDCGSERAALRILILTPLKELSNIPQPDVRQRQLDCVLQILHNNGDALSDGWPVIMEIIGTLSENHGEHLIRVAFQCLELVVTDFLQTMPSSSLRLCVDSVARFGSQSQELNVSLSAVGLLWNVADHFHQNREQIQRSLEAGLGGSGVTDTAAANRTPTLCIVPEGSLEAKPFEKLWMCLYSWLAELCIDARSAVRKSAGQTLFSTVSAHGAILQQDTWQNVVSQVLFPLLDRVQSLSNSASSDKMDLGGNILIHHSRNTAQKQWAETQVLVLSGVARVFATKQELLTTFGDFGRVWALLLEFIESGALGNNDEVALAALKSFQEIVLAAKLDVEKQPLSPEETMMWSTAWKVWYKIGIESTKSVTAENNKPGSTYIPSQAFLTALLQIFPPLFNLLKPRFVATDLSKFSAVLTEVVAVPIHSEPVNTFLLPSITDPTLTPLQESVLQAVSVLKHAALSNEEGSLRAAIPQLITLLLTFSEYACRGPKSIGDVNNTSSGQKFAKACWAGAFYVPMAEKALEMAIALYTKTAESPSIVQAGVFRDILKALRLPLSQKYSCPSQTTWKLAIHSLLSVLAIGLPVARKHEKDFTSSWSELAMTLEEFLFPKSVPPNTRTMEESQADEAIDCKVVQVIRTEILGYSTFMPKEFVLKVVSLLDRGSIHSSTGSLSIEPETHGRLREEFARLCFETLLQYSFLHASGRHPGHVTREIDGSSQNADGSAGTAGKLAVAALLHRFKEVVSKYVEDERLGNKCPLPRRRTSEMSFVLKAVSTLTIALKKAPPGTVSSEVWQQLIDLYPHLVDCTMLVSPQVTRALKEALTEYYELLKVPSKDSQLNNLI